MEAGILAEHLTRAWRRERKQDHLVCFLGGLLMLGATMGKSYDPAAMANDIDRRDWSLGQELTKTCMRTYAKTATGLGAEIVHFYPHLEAVRKAGDDTGRAWYIDKRRRYTHSVA
jgi:mannosyl-oligosaccharide alpha-1,2-mannosidase